MTESEKRAALLPCPFCGGAAKAHHPSNLDGWTVSCTKCDTEGSEWIDEGAAGRAWNRRASSPPVPQQLAKLKSALYDISSGDFDATDDEVRALMCVIQELHLDQRLRGVKTNQEIDAMVREMKQPSDEKDAARYRLLRDWCVRQYGLYVTDGNNPVYEEELDRRLDVALHAEPVKKMKGEGA